jgi:hypothetical protein
VLIIPIIYKTDTGVSVAQVYREIGANIINENTTLEKSLATEDELKMAQELLRNSILLFVKTVTADIDKNNISPKIPWNIFLTKNEDSHRSQKPPDPKRKDNNRSKWIDAMEKVFAKMKVTVPISVIPGKNSWFPGFLNVRKVTFSKQTKIVIVHQILDFY